MPSFESPALYIDFSRLPAPSVIEEIDFEEILGRYHDQVTARNPALVKALSLEQSPTNTILECQSYGEMIVRSRINAAARAVMLPFATGSDLDNLGALLNVARLQWLDADGTTVVTETDERFRTRIRLAVETFSSAGPPGAYIYHALTVAPTLRDVAAISPQPGYVTIILMNQGNDPTPTQGQIDVVFERLHEKHIKPLTDVVSVVPVTRIDVDVVANVRLYPGPDGALVLTDINKAMQKLRDRLALTGRDLTRSSLMAALTQEGVQGVELVSPAEDIIVTAAQCVWMTSATINIVGSRSE